MADSKPKADPVKKVQTRVRNVEKELDALVEAISHRLAIPKEVLRGEPEPEAPTQVGQEEAA